MMSNSTEQPEKQYEPFGDDWKKEMNKFSKGRLIIFVQMTCKEKMNLTEKNEKLVSALRELYNRAKIYGAFADTNDLNGQALAKAKAAIEQNKI